MTESTYLSTLSSAHMHEADLLEKEIDKRIAENTEKDGMISFEIENFPTQSKLVLDYLESKYFQIWRGGVFIIQTENVICVGLAR